MGRGARGADGRWRLGRRSVRLHEEGRERVGATGQLRARASAEEGGGAAAEGGVAGDDGVVLPLDDALLADSESAGQGAAREACGLAGGDEGGVARTKGETAVPQEGLGGGAV